MSREWLALVLLLANSQVSAAEMAPLKGSWTAIEAWRDGAAAPELLGNRIEFTGERFRISKPGSLIHSGRYAANPEALPAQIDFMLEEGVAKGQSWSGIYRIDNGRLTICDNAPKPTAPRQSTFEAGKGSAYVCLTFRR